MAIDFNVLQHKTYQDLAFGDDNQLSMLNRWSGIIIQQIKTFPGGYVHFETNIFKKIAHVLSNSILSAQR